MNSINFLNIVKPSVVNTKVKNKMVKFNKKSLNFSISNFINLESKLRLKLNRGVNTSSNKYPHNFKRLSGRWRFYWRQNKLIFQKKNYYNKFNSRIDKKKIIQKHVPHHKLRNVSRGFYLHGKFTKTSSKLPTKYQDLFAFKRQKRRKVESINNFYKERLNAFFKILDKRRRNSLSQKASTNVGIYIYNTFNNFYIVCFDIYENRVLSFISCGMVDSLKRYNRKNRYTLELCGRRLALFLLENKKYLAFIVLKSFFFKKLLKSTVKGLLYYNLRITKFYNHRLRAHNGALKRKARRL
jgi:ribosomal protein S11